MHIDDLVRMEVLWSAQSRGITTTASHTDEEQRRRIYNERIQLLINGNLLGARQRNGKVRLQFLGVRLKDPPAGPYNLGVPVSNMMVSRQDQIEELQNNRYTRGEQQWLGPCDGWIRPWAVRALSGHSVHFDPEKNLMELDPHKFAIPPSILLVSQIGGAFHATSCRNLLSIVERGILPGAAIAEDYGSRYEAGGLHSYFAIFAPWDLRNTTTKQRVSGRGNQRMPLTVLCIPSMDLQGGRITDSGNIIVSRPVPFNLVKEAWFCVPKDNDRRGFELVEKIMDERLEDELVLAFQPSPILRDFKKDRTPARIMGLLCDMPTGPHNAEKERLLCALAASVDYHPEDTRRHHHMKEAVVFMIKHTRPGDFCGGTGGNEVRLRLCPACYYATPSRFSRCTMCWSQFISCGKFRRTEPEAEASVEVPSTNIAQTMEAAAAAAVPATGAEEDENLETMTVAEPEMEVEERLPSEGEPEPDEELPDITEYQEDVSAETLEERRTFLLAGRAVITDPELLIAQTSMQPPYYPDMKTGYCVDAMPPAFAFWPSTSSWLTMPYDTMQERFRTGSRYDVLGNWPANHVCCDPETNISREVTDEEIQACCAHGRGEIVDPDGHWVLKRFRANQILSALTRGSIQMGYTRSTFNPETDIKRGQTTKQMHFSCLGVLCEIIPKITGYSQFSLIRPTPTGPTEFLYIDPVGVILMQSQGHVWYHYCTRHRSQRSGPRKVHGQSDKAED